MGCRSEVQRGQLESHIEFSTKSHLDLACGELRDTQEKLKEKIIHFGSLEDRVHILGEQLEEKVKDIQHQHQNDVNFLQREHQLKVGFLQEQLEQKVKTCQTKLEEKINMERKIFLICLVLGLVFLTFYLTKLDDKFNSLSTDLSNKLLILEVDTEESRIFIWKITSFEDKLRQGQNDEAKYIQSVPFYAYGYKLILRLYPNGFGEGENTHLSIAIAVLKGEYDAILPWGFSKRVTFTLIDQQDNPNPRQNVVMGITADPNNIAFTKPVEGKARAGHGFPQFVSHNDLRKRRFVVDDTLFIKFQVDSPKAYKSWFEL